MGERAIVLAAEERSERFTWLHALLPVALGMTAGIDRKYPAEWTRWLFAPGEGRWRAVLLLSLIFLSFSGPTKHRALYGAILGIWVAVSIVKVSWLHPLFP